jgi:hypothetical protein
VSLKTAQANQYITIITYRAHHITTTTIIMHHGVRYKAPCPPSRS